MNDLDGEKKVPQSPNERSGRFHFKLPMLLNHAPNAQEPEKEKETAGTNIILVSIF